MQQLDSLDEKTLEKISKLDLSTTIKNGELNEQILGKLSEFSKNSDQVNTNKLNNLNPYAKVKTDSLFMQAANGNKLVSPEVNKGLC